MVTMEVYLVQHMACFKTELVYCEGLYIGVVLLYVIFLCKYRITPVPGCNIIYFLGRWKLSETLKSLLEVSGFWWLIFRPEYPFLFVDKSKFCFENHT